MAEDHWQPSRLIPTSGISGPDEAERRATSALLAVMEAVREFGTAIVKPLGAPAGNITTFIEVPFKLGDATVIPDGLVQTSRGTKSWTCLVEVKTGSSELHRQQVENYLDVARESGFDIVLTISNEIAPAPGVHPVEVDRRKLRKVALHHLSWAEILTTAVQQRVHRGVSDPDQAWILGELIRYLEHPKSGALDFVDMGAAWVGIREAITAQTLRANDKGLPEVISRWEQLLRFAALRLGRELGAEVQVALSRKEAAEPALRFAAQTQSLVKDGRLIGSLRIADAIGHLDICADMRAGQVTVSVDVDAPKDGRAATRVNWLTRQLREAPDGLRIDAYAAASRTSSSSLLRDVREQPTLLIEDPKRDLRMFRVAATSPMGSKRGIGRGGFIDSVLVAIDGFYGAVIQQLRPWAAKAPQLPAGGRTAAETAGLDIAPPPMDLNEDADSELSTHPAQSVASDVVDGVDAAQDNAPDVDQDRAGDDEPAITPTVIAWDDAQERLDHERAFEIAVSAQALENGPGES